MLYNSDIEIRTFEQLTALYLKNQKGRVKESTYYTAEKIIVNHILPFFSEMNVRDITPFVILTWEQTKSSYSCKYRRTLRAHLGSILRFGNRYFDLPNALPKVEPIRNTEQKKEMNIWTKDEFATFLRVVDDPTYRCLFRFLFITGCRKGEAFALSPGDLNPTNCTVSITKSLTRKVYGRTYAITSPKNMASNRIIDLPQGIMDDLLALTPSDSNFLFGGDKPLADNTVNRRFRQWVEMSGVKRIRIHDLRHSSASYLISEGVTIVAVSKRLGHSDIEQTLNTYSHVLPQDNVRINKLFMEI